MKTPSGLLGLALLVLALPLAAQDTGATSTATNAPGATAAADDDNAPLEYFDTLRDPTMISTRVGLGYEGLQKHNGDFRNKFLLNGTYAFTLCSSNDTGVAVEEPVVSQNYGDDGSGLGDFKFTFGHVFKPHGRFRWALGMENQFNTATSDEIGDGVIKLTPFYAWQLKLAKSVQFGGRLKYNYSVYEEPGRARANSIEFNPQLLAEWPHDIYTAVAWNSEWTLVNSGHYIGKFEPQIGKAFGKRNQWVAYVGVEIPWVHAGSDICTYKTGLSYLFK